jgi:hypothetical protein
MHCGREPGNAWLLGGVVGEATALHHSTLPPAAKKTRIERDSNDSAAKEFPPKVATLVQPMDLSPPWKFA